MARFQLTAALHTAQARYRAGTILADSQANALPGDKVWTGMNAASLIADMVALDGAATTMRNASKYAGVTPRGWITGAESIDA
jgi:hypothetical protein